MRRIEVATGVWVVDYEAGIGGEGYDPPEPYRQWPAYNMAPAEESVGRTAIAAVTQEQIEE